MIGVITQKNNNSHIAPTVVEKLYGQKLWWVMIVSNSLCL